MGEMVSIATVDVRKMKFNFENILPDPDSFWSAEEVKTVMKAHNRPMKRRVPGAMSKTEERFAELLNEYARDKQIVSYSFEPVTFKLAEGVRYTPDFMAVFADPTRGVAFYEIKASEFHASGKSNQMNSLTKLKVCARTFPQFYFFKCYPRKKSEGGAWMIEPIKV